MTTFSRVEIGRDVALNPIDRKDDVLRVDLWRTISSVGNWQVVLRNIDGKYNEVLPTGLPNNPDNVFDVQDDFLIEVNNLGDILMQGKVDGPGVVLRGSDLEDIWDEYVVLKGVDQAQDLLFHNDFEYSYTNPANTLHDILSDVFWAQLGYSAIPIGHTTNIQYDNVLAPIPTVGAFEFKSGVSLLSELQELTRIVDYVFYIDDSLWFRAGPPGGIKLGATAATIQTDPANPNSNVIGAVEYQTRDGDKHYNYIKLLGKAPMFDGYTEYNAADWAVSIVTGVDTTGGILDSTTSMVGDYSIVAYNQPIFAPATLGMRLDAPVYNYTTWDLSQGEIGIWAKYDNMVGAPGNPAVGHADAQEYVHCFLTDSGGDIAMYYGDSTLLYIDNWGYCRFPLGEQNYAWVGWAANEWTRWGAATDIDWKNIVSIEFSVGSVLTMPPSDPSHFYIDGIGLPFPIISISENAGIQATYRRRPYSDIYANIRTQNALDLQAQQILSQSQNTLIEKLKVVVEGDENIRYAGQSISVNIPKLGITPLETYYITQLHHMIEPMVDVSQGYGFDWITEIDCIPVSGVAYDMSRLGIGQSLQSLTQKIQRLGVGTGSR